MSGRHRRRHYQPRAAGYTACGLLPSADREVGYPHDRGAPALMTTAELADVTCALCRRTYAFEDAGLTR
jgi:hypothetical protein